MQAVDTYLAVRRTVGFALVPIESYLRSFARFATARGETHVVTTTAIDWASLAPSEAQRHYRLQTVVRFARFMAAEDPQHQIGDGIAGMDRRIADGGIDRDGAGGKKGRPLAE